MDWVKVLGGSGNSSLRSLRILKTARMARSLRLLRLMKLQAIWESIMDRVANSSHLQILSDMIKNILLIFVITHVVACGWFGLCSGSSDDESYTGWLSMPEYSDG